MDVVKPSTYLADIFNDKVCGIVSFEFLLVLKGVVELGKWHGTGFEPTV